MTSSVESSGVTETASGQQLNVTSESIERVLGERYQLIRQLGAGGMGVVYLAHDTITKRTVVVKVLRTDLPSSSDDGSSAARLRREAERLASVRHANIVEFFDFGVHEKSPFIVMEYIVGRRLDEFIAEVGVLQIDVFVPIASQVLKAIGYAHSLNVVLRDIKPENIMLCRRSGKDLFVKVLDFGLARLVGGDGQDRVTRDQLVGTPSCISPEEIQGKELDGRADVYALGVLFYRMLTGVNPFEADSTAALLYKHINEPPAPFSSHGLDDIAPPLEALVMRCLAKDPDDRPADANAVMEALIDAAPTSMFRLPAAGTYAALHRQSTSDSIVTNASSIISRADVESAFDSEANARAADEDERKGLPMWMIGAGIAAAVALSAIGYAVISGDDGDAAQQTAEAGGDGLSEIEGLLRAGELDAADRIIDKAVDGNPDAATLARAEVLRTKIQLERMLRRAQALELSGEEDGALDAYLSVLEDDPDNIPATDAIRRIRASKPSADEAGGMVNLDSVPTATLFVDGESVGETPVQTRLALGPHQLRLDVNGETVWNDRVDVKEEGLTRSIVLQGRGEDGAAVVSSAPRSGERSSRRRRPKPQEPAAVATPTPGTTKPEPTEFERLDRPKGEEFGKIERREDEFGKLDRGADGSKLRPM